MTKMRNCLLSFLFILLLPHVSYQQLKKGNWFNGQYGVFVHYLSALQNNTPPWNMGKRTSWDSCINEFNVNFFASDVASTGAKHVIFTLQQKDQYICGPFSLYERLTGYRRGEATSTRDLINELSYALKKYNIKLFLYITGDGPKDDDKASHALKNPSVKQRNEHAPFLVDKEWVNNWAAIINDISIKYKGKIAGWWLDGCYPFIGYTDRFLSIFKTAIRKGNKNAIVAFNQAPKPKVSLYSKLDDYTAGEMDSFIDIPESRFLKSTQWHILSYLGQTWGSPNVRYTSRYMADYIDKVIKKGGVVSIDVCLLRDGHISSAPLDSLIKVKKIIYNL